MKHAAVHLAFNYSEAWVAGNSSAAASVFAGAGEKISFFPSQLRSQMNVHSPTPTPVGAYLSKRVAFKCLLDLYRAGGTSAHAPSFAASLGNTLSALPEDRPAVLQGPDSPLESLDCKVTQDVGEGNNFKCTACGIKGQAVEGDWEKTWVQSCLCLGQFVLLGIRLSSDSCREVSAWHQGWPQA